MEGYSYQSQEDSKCNSDMFNNQMQSTLIPAFPVYYPAYSGLPMRSTFPPYSLPPKPKRQLNKFTIFEKLQAIERVNSGETKAHVARSINVAESTLRGWFKNADKLRTLYETEEIPNTGTGAEYSSSSSKNVKKEEESSFSEPCHMLQAKSFNNYNYSWLEFFRNFEKLPLQYFDTSVSCNSIEEGAELGRKFLRWLEEYMAKGDKTLNINCRHVEAFRNLLTDIFRVPAAHVPQVARKHIVGDDEDKEMDQEAVKLEKSRPIERKHIVGDDEDIEKMEDSEDEDDDFEDDDKI